ncbi:MAG: hypothetical protein HUU15_02215 [Candidatus Brocadiae bacterium]|nr:hypothetical protein [Candidatus Brocadiia bacterium]
MTRRLLPALALAALLPFSLRPAAEEPAFAWQDDLEAARARAKSEGRPLLIVFR